MKNRCFLSHRASPCVSTTATFCCCVVVPSFHWLGPNVFTLLVFVCSLCLILLFCFPVAPPPVYCFLHSVSDPLLPLANRCVGLLIQFLPVHPVASFFENSSRLPFPLLSCFPSPLVFLFFLPLIHLVILLSTIPLSLVVTLLSTIFSCLVILFQSTSFYSLVLPDGLGVALPSFPFSPGGSSSCFLFPCFCCRFFLLSFLPG